MRKTCIHLGLSVLTLLACGLFALPAEAAPSCATVNISGPSNVYAETSCVMPVWSATCSCPYGATPTYSWSIGGIPAGSGASATQTYCPDTPAQTYTIQVTVDITCGRAEYNKSKSVFISICDDSTSPPTCNG